MKKQRGNKSNGTMKMDTNLTEMKFIEKIT